MRNEAVALPTTLAALQPFRQRGVELIAVDGESSDASVTIAKPRVDQVLRATPGRAVQMNRGAQAAHGEILWFLHADTIPPANADSLIYQALEDNKRHWGRFDVRLSGTHPFLRIVETLMNERSRWTGIATGDQGIFVRRCAFEQVGGYPPIALMEDIALSDRLKHLSAPVCLRDRLVTSSRRWERKGIVRTILLMWFLRFAYFLGASPVWLQRLYRESR